MKRRRRNDDHVGGNADGADADDGVSGGAPSPGSTNDNDNVDEGDGRRGPLHHRPDQKRRSGPDVRDTPNQTNDANNDVKQYAHEASSSQADSIGFSFPITTTKGNGDTAMMTMIHAVYHESISHSSSALDRCMRLFQDNMSSMYEHSSWGLDVDNKRAELAHEDAKYLMVHAVPGHRRTSGPDDGSIDASLGKSNDNNTSTSTSTETGEFVGFCHFRLEPEDDDDRRNSETVLYIYELQLSSQFQGNRIGQRIMEHLETVVAKNVFGVNKLMLTVFQHNPSAVRFYKQKLGYSVHYRGDDYEILSKTINAPRCKRRRHLQRQDTNESKSASSNCVLN
uniref:N-alpha-acetyltransferase 40 n=1 Tax=Craspedostauros australis TaxID=1486917 RepID=A0A7S0F708_9STRA|mmetsp:Transcript_8601/g.23225  ORF Transcript_8601/g.23225 Transcript_8601/m.23225 type:complete len:338 (+) Transcript_8601:92-1105(+)|eukprot:CAMPEP_0198116210 /NCGR_PEP_ID=MMETSP1442-20131203/10609_1 /TAXON_ID= /ORGANISM="Craspedostauros australis, Strain CCMP3328" /LENGTH=337 /DNA_ID=CAMNT_0043773969 /DNA_START=51 /DNA_END=1064 /DNA_ORIENTATION=-